MGNYRNFKLVTYFVAHATEHIDKETLQKQINWFGKHMRLDKVYLEPYRDGLMIPDDQLKMVKTFQRRIVRFQRAGAHVQGSV